RRVLIYNRDRSRQLINAEEVAAQLRLRLPALASLAAAGAAGVAGTANAAGTVAAAVRWEVDVMLHSNARHPCELVQRLHEVDVLVTPHGFQSMMILFLQPGAVLFELYPYKYYKLGYKALAPATGVRYEFAMSEPQTLRHKLLLHYISTERCMSFYFCRSFARSDNVRMSDADVERVVALAGVSARRASGTPRRRRMQQRLPAAGAVAGAAATGAG
ncbi:unnamed protein product, partial [Phaeothamnion confervicola]